MGEIKGRFEGNCNGGTIAGNITGELYGKLNRCKVIGSIIQKGITEINLSYVLGEICWSKLVGVPPTPPQFNRVTMTCKFLEESCCSTKPDHGNCPSGYSVSEDGLKCQKCPEGQISDGQTCRRCPYNKVPNKDQSKCQKCPDGTMRTEDGLKCQSCPEGHVSTDGHTCWKCPNDHVPNKYRSKCLKCLTTKGFPCKFPFKHKKKSYNYCKESAFGNWCATEVDQNLGSVHKICDRPFPFNSVGLIL